MNNQAKIKLEKIKKLKLPEKVRATADKIEKGLSSADSATQKKAEDALNKLYEQIKAVAAKQREEKTEKEVNEKTIVPQNADIAAPEAKKELTKKTTDADDIIDKALKDDPELAGFGKSDKRRDAGRKAQPAGRRVARKGWKNQYGKSDGGRVYYENRENRTDRKSPSFKSGYPYLAKGGKIHPMDDDDGTFYVNLYKTKGDQIVSVDEREYKSKASAMTYAMMKRDFMKVGESIFVMNEDGDVLYTSIGTKKMAMGGKFAWQNAQVGDSARVILENKMGTVMATYGRRFHLKFPDGTEKTYSAEELEFYPEEEYARGGNIYSSDEMYEVKMVSDGIELDSKLIRARNKKEAREIFEDMYREKYEDEFGPFDLQIDVAESKMAQGGNIDAPSVKLFVKNEDGEVVFTTNSVNKAADYITSNGRDKFSVETEDGRKIFDKGLYMAKGGKIDESTQMVLNENKAIAHHTKELKKALSKNTKVEPWVVAKIERASTDISDVTHYLEGRTEYAKGGYMAKGENYEYVNTFKRFDSNVPVPQEDFEKLVDAYHKQLSGDKLAVSKYKVLKLQMGNYLGQKTVEEMEEYIEKTHNAHKMAKGGEIEVSVGDKVKSKSGVDGVVYESTGTMFKLEDKYGNKSQKWHSSRDFKPSEITKGDYMAKAGVTSKLDYIPRRQIKLIIIKNPNKKGTRNYLQIDKKDFLDGLYLEKGGKIDKTLYTYIPRTMVNQVVTVKNEIKSNPKNGFWVSNEALNKAGRYLEKAFKKDDVVYNKESNTIGIVRSDSYGDGTTNTDSDGVVSTTLLEKFNPLTHASASIANSTLKEIRDRDLVPEEDMKPRNAPNKSLFNKTYLRKSKVLGWTADTYTDGKHYGFDWKISTYKRGDYLTSVAQAGKDENGIWSFILYQDPNIVLIREYNKRSTEKSVGEQQEKALKMFEEKLDDGTIKSKVDSKMAKGGKIGFEALSKKVASRYEGKKVKPKYQSEYGKTYNAEEAKEVGDKVASKVYRLQQSKMAKGGELEKGILTEMKEHGMSREEATKTAQDHLKEDSKYYTKMAKIGLKKGGKIALPHELDRYFTKPKGTIEVEISKLIPIRARKSGIENAEVYMKKAYDGEMAKRKPIEIYKTRNKKYRVNDGNSTFAVAKKNGWETIYATVVPNPNVKARVEKSTFTIAKEIRKEGESWADAVQRVKNMRK